MTTLATETATTGASPRRPARRGWWTVASPLALLVLWEVLSRLDVVDSRVLPPPSEVLLRIGELVTSGELLPHVQATVVRFVVGLVLGAVAGTVVGLTMGLFPAARAVVSPLIAVIYPLPRIAMFPLILILVGFNERANILEITLAPFFTMAISTMSAVLAIDPIYRDVARSFETGTRDLYLRVTLPAALPAVMGALRVSVGLALMSTTAVEFLAASEGLGYLIWHSWQILSLQDCLSGMVVAGLLGSLAYGAVGVLARLLVPWQSRPS
jgi:ABC-type nitrate/sulfonate/bicarbonate transport system permease component